MTCPRCGVAVRWALLGSGKLLALVPDPKGRLQLEWRDSGKVQGWVVIVGDGGYSTHFCNVPGTPSRVRA